MADASAGPRIYSGTSSRGNAMAIWRECVGGEGDRSLTRSLSHGNVLSGEVSETIDDDCDEECNCIVEGPKVASRRGRFEATASWVGKRSATTNWGRISERAAFSADGTVSIEARHHGRTYEHDILVFHTQARGGVRDVRSHLLL